MKDLGWKLWNEAKRVARIKGELQSTAILCATGPEQDR